MQDYRITQIPKRTNLCTQASVRILVSLPPAIGTVLDQVMKWTSNDIEAAMWASTEALEYSELTSNYK